MSPGRFPTLNGETTNRTCDKAGEGRRRPPTIPFRDLAVVSIFHLAVGTTIFPDPSKSVSIRRNRPSGASLDRGVHFYSQRLPNCKGFEKGLQVLIGKKVNFFTKSPPGPFHMGKPGKIHEKTSKSVKMSKADSGGSLGFLSRNYQNNPANSFDAAEGHLVPIVFQLFYQIVRPSS